MDERTALLEKLVREQHINVAERLSLGAIAEGEVARTLKTHLLRHGVYPLRPEHVAVYEGATILTKPSGFQITWERGYPWDPHTVAERHVEVFTSIDIAIKVFMESEWKSGIDGIQITSKVQFQ